MWLPVSKGIGRLNETHLHESLKFLYSNNIENHEFKLGRYFVDVKLEDHLVEIQTSNVGSIRRKLVSLLEFNKVKLVHPIIHTKYIVKHELNGTLISRRKSPKRGNILDCFQELVRIPELLSNKNFTIEIILIDVDEYWVNDHKGSWRRKGWSKVDKKLLKVRDRKVLTTRFDFLNLLPVDLPPEFTTKDIVNKAHIRLNTAQKICYTLFHAGFINRLGKTGRYHTYSAGS